MVDLNHNIKQTLFNYTMIDTVYDSCYHKPIVLDIVNHFNRSGVNLLSIQDAQ